MMYYVSADRTNFGVSHNSSWRVCQYSVSIIAFRLHDLCERPRLSDTASIKGIYTAIIGPESSKLRRAAAWYGK